MPLRLKELASSLTFADIILFILLLFFSVGSLAFVHKVMPHGNSVIVEVDGKELYQFPRDEVVEQHIESVEGHAILEIKDGRARLAESDCRNQICVRQGWISNGAIVCLPNRIIIRVGAGGSEGNKVDAVSR